MLEKQSSDPKFRSTYAIIYVLMRHIIFGFIFTS